MGRRGTLVLILLSVLSLALILFSKLFFSSSNNLVARVIDGDTIVLKDGRVIRYIGIDAPEKKECFWEEAKKLNEQLVSNKPVRLEFDTNQMDRFGRYLAYVYLDDLLVNRYLLEKGAAKFFLDTVNTKHQKKLIEAAELAHQKRVGLWQKCATNPKIGCIIKGNLDKYDKRFYHLPEYRHYPTVKVNLEKGDQWFCTEEEAKKAGFIPARK
jgi:micrococcal nuclease